MSKPESIRVEPWSDFPKQSYSILTDDFPHEKLYTAKVNSKGDRSTVNIKAVVTRNDKGEFAVADQAKFFFRLPEGKAIYSKIKSSNYLKVHYDNGITRLNNRDWNFYASVNTNKSLENISLRVGATHLSKVCHSDNRLKYEGRNLTWYNRTLVNQDKLTFGLLTAFGFANRVLAKNNLLLGYQIDDRSSAFIRAENNKFRNTPLEWSNVGAYFDVVKFDFVSKYQNINYAIETVFNTRGGQFFNDASLVLQHTNAESKLTSKVRFNSKLDTSIAFKFPSRVFKDIATASLGVHGRNLFTDKRSFQYGGQIEFNV